MADTTQMPPGTILLELMLNERNAETVLHPVPSSDPNDPLNWPRWYKTLNFGLVCYYTLMVFADLDVGTVIWSNLNEELHLSFEDLNISYGINTAGLGVGCIILIPLALKFGRKAIYLGSIAVSLATCLWQARMETRGDLLGSNLVSGIAGATAEAICQMTIADMYFVHERGVANAVYLLTVKIGAFLSLIPAGYIATAQGWRWIWWWCSIFLSVCLLLFTLFYEDTKYTPTYSGVQPTEIDDVETSYSIKSKDSGNLADIVVTGSRHLDVAVPRKSYLQRQRLVHNTPGWRPFFRHIYRPFVVLVTLPAVTFSAVAYGSLLAWFSLAVNTYSTYFTEAPYNFGSDGIGLLNLAPFIGVVIGSGFLAFTTDRSIIWLARRNGGIYEPEMRLWTSIPGIIILPFSLLWYGFSMADKDNWIVPAVGLSFFGFGWIVSADVALTYCMDCYQNIVPDAFVGIVFVRNVLATILSTTLTKWIDGVGLKNVFVMSTVISLAISLLTIPMIIWGKRLRIWSAPRYAEYSANQYSARI